MLSSFFPLLSAMVLFFGVVLILCGGEGGDGRRVECGGKYRSMST